MREHVPRKILPPIERFIGRSCRASAFSIEGPPDFIASRLERGDLQAGVILLVLAREMQFSPGESLKHLQQMPMKET
jgi:hypothetical protein